MEEAINIIEDIIHNVNRYKELSDMARRRSLIFDETVFSSKFRALIKSMVL